MGNGECRRETRHTRRFKKLTPTYTLTYYLAPNEGGVVTEPMLKTIQNSLKNISFYLF